VHSDHTSRQPASRDSFTGAGDLIVAHRHPDQITEDDVITLPDLVYLPEQAHGDGHPRWLWREHRSMLLPGAHAWRWVYDADGLGEDPDGIGACVSLGFVLLRVSDDQPNQGGEHRDLILCLRALDLVAVQAERPTVGEASPTKQIQSTSGTT
jgi:hypothetical protein